MLVTYDKGEHEVTVRHNVTGLAGTFLYTFEVSEWPEATNANSTQRAKEHGTLWGATLTLQSRKRFYDGSHVGTDKTLSEAVRRELKELGAERIRTEADE
jgi:hypothetical protein